MTLDEKIAAMTLQFPGGNLQDIIRIMQLKNEKMNIMQFMDRLMDGGNRMFLLRTGYSCNLHCRHCFAEYKKSELDFSLDQLKKMIDEIGDRNMVVLTGGEPTIRVDLLEILKYLKTRKTGYLVELQSNGVKFSDKTFLEKLEPYFDSIFLPFHSSNMSIFDKVTQVPGSGDLVVQALKNLAASSIRVMTNIVINRFNYKTITETMDFIQKINPGCTMALTHLHPIGGGDSTEVAPRYDEIHDDVQKALKKYGYLIHTHYIPRCRLYPYQELVSNADDWENGSKTKPGINHQDGEWKKIDYASYGGTLYVDEKVDPKWATLNIEQSKIKSVRCKECRFDKDCIGIWKEYGFLYPDLTDLIPIEKD